MPQSFARFRQSKTFHQHNTTFPMQKRPHRSILSLTQHMNGNIGHNGRDSSAWHKRSNPWTSREKRTHYTTTTTTHVGRSHDVGEAAPRTNTTSNLCARHTIQTHIIQRNMRRELLQPTNKIRRHFTLLLLYAQYSGEPPLRRRVATCVVLTDLYACSENILRTLCVSQCTSMKWINAH